MRILDEDPNLGQFFLSSNDKENHIEWLDYLTITRSFLSLSKDVKTKETTEERQIFEQDANKSTPRDNDAAGLQPVRVPCKHDFPAFSVRLSLSPWKSEQIYVALTRRTAYLRTIITTRITCEEGLDPDCPLLRLLSLVFLPFDTLAESLSARGAFSVGTEHANGERDIRWKETMITLFCTNGHHFKVALNLSKSNGEITEQKSSLLDT